MKITFQIFRISFIITALNGKHPPNYIATRIELSNLYKCVEGKKLFLRITILHLYMCCDLIGSLLPGTVFINQSNYI